ncbi:MAG: bifunctional folylpolyglutamate synthase/dihydrofolate synthase, partial [Lachnospiraceae bacterium]|nr:bifunctional folylpolyglutamate synthase/dihydrofolate synthase [Candidatus Minthocola equi]
MVLAIIRALRDKGYEISEEAVREGLATAKWPARFEILKENKFVLDGGHNPQCAEALVAAAGEYFPQGKVNFLMGMLADKDYEQVIDIIAPIANEFYTITPDSPRALSAGELAKTIEAKGMKATPYDDKEKAMDAAMASDKPLIA